MLNKKHTTNAIIIWAFWLIHITNTLYADDDKNREWTKKYIYSLIGQSTNFPMSEEAQKEWNRLKNEVDSTAHFLIEILNEETHGTMLANTLAVIAHSKNKHELFSSAISNKLESFKSDVVYDTRTLKWGATRTLGIFEQARKNANTNILVDGTNITQNIGFLQTNAAQVFDEPTSNVNLVTQDKNTPNEKNEQRLQRKLRLWFFVFPVVAGIMWFFGRKKN